jgi:hypothetical protein
MASIDHQEQPTGTGRATLLDDWRAEVGDDEIARIVHEVRRDAAAGLIPSFTD